MLHNISNRLYKACNRHVQGNNHIPQQGAILSAVTEPTISYFEQFTARPRTNAQEVVLSTAKADHKYLIDQDGRRRKTPDSDSRIPKKSANQGSGEFTDPYFSYYFTYLLRVNSTNLEQHSCKVIH